MNNETEVSIKFKNQVTGEKKLKDYAETLKNINSVLSGLNADSTKDLSQSANDTKDISKDISNISKKTSIAFNYNLITKFAGAIKKLASSFGSLTKQSFDYLENFNLFQVAFNGNYDSATKFVNKMSEMYGLDESWLIQTTGKFKQLANAMGVTEQTGERVAELLTQMSVDISSLYNVDFSRASSVLQSTLAGQTKPIRGLTGADITQATLQTTLDQLGIENTVKNLSFAEKRLLIIISLTNQLKGSIGDLGRTIESPSNQMRILNDQWERLTRAVGNVFLPILAKILPYLNAILMVLTEIISTIAALVGYNEDDFDYFDASSTGAWDLSDGLANANSNAKKLKQGLRGFDKLNVITTPSAASGVGGTGGTGINTKLLDAFNKTFEDYQNTLSNVEMKATRIRDNIMEWLGFTKEVDEETGKVSFKFDHITGGTVLGALIVGGAIYKGISMILGLLTKIGLLNFSGLIGGGVGANATGLAGALNTLNLLTADVWLVTIAVVGILEAINQAQKLKEELEELSNINKTEQETWEKNRDAMYEHAKASDNRAEEMRKLKNEVKEHVKYVNLQTEGMRKSKTVFGDFDGTNKKINEDIDKLNKTMYEDIELLKQMAKDGDITQEEYEELAKAILDNAKALKEQKPAILDNQIETWIYDQKLKDLENRLNDVSDSKYKVDFNMDPLDNVSKSIDGIEKGLNGLVKNPWKIAAQLNITESSKKTLNKLLEPLKKLGFNVPTFANGGLPKVGQLFVANERGPELIGQIGGQSFVANQNQVVDLIDKKLGQSQNQVIKPTIIVQVGNKEIAKQVINDLQDMSKTNGKPIIIGG